MKIRKPAVSMVTYLFKGILIGLADLVPGVSGGTIAFVTGIYEKLLTNIKAFDGQMIIHLLTFRLAKMRGKIDGFFLLNVFLGMSLSILFFSHIFFFLLTNELTNLMLLSFFMGVICTAIGFLIKDLYPWNKKQIIFFIVGLIIAILTQRLSASDHLYSKEMGVFLSADFEWKLILVGMVVIAAMLLPGISGSFLLVLFGLYTKSLHAIVLFTTHLQEGRFHFPAFIYLIQLTTGIIIGLVIFSRLILFLLKSYRSQMLSTICGLMLGSIHILWPFHQVSRSFSSITLFLLFFLLGLSLFIILNNKKSQFV